MKYRNQTVRYNSNGYPWVYIPNHPRALSNGMVYVHVTQAYEKYGDYDKNLQVHHIDHNKKNFDKDNIELVDDNNHRKLHNRIKEITICEFCEVEFIYKKIGQRFCSKECHSKTTNKIEWPSYNELKELVETSNYSAIGRMLGVSDNAVRKRLKNHAPVAEVD
jgi:hypothetical protein